MRNAMTIDVEDYFQVSALACRIAPADWETLPSRIEANVERVLALLADHHAQATFFTLGWLAQRYPQLVQRIVAAGHELASHGYAHQRATTQSPSEFRLDVATARTMLEQTGGCAVRGYRAPSFSIGARNPWAWQVLQDVGYRYSSSVYPIRHDHYGMPAAPRDPWHPCPGAPLLELPISTVRLARHNFPAGGGGYFRLLPYCVSRWALRRINQSEQRAAIFYLHPWELDPQQPRVSGLPLRNQLRHYLNLAHTHPRMQRLLGDFAWGRIDQVFAEQLS